MQFPLDQIPSSQVPDTAQAAGTGLKEDSFALNALNPFGGSVNIDDLSNYNEFDLSLISGNTGLFSEAQIAAIVRNFDWEDMTEPIDGGGIGTDLLNIPKLSRSSTANSSQTTSDPLQDLPAGDLGDVWEMTAWEKALDDPNVQLHDGSPGDWYDPVEGFMDLGMTESVHPLQMSSVADPSSYSQTAFAIGPNMTFDGRSWFASVPASRMVDASTQTETSTERSAYTE